MAKTTKSNYLIGICTLVFSLTALGQGVKSENELREDWLREAIRQVGVVERTNRNDHDSIYKYNAFAKVPKNSPYCGAGLFYTAHKAGVFLPIKSPAQVVSWFRDPKKIIWTRTSRRWIMPPKLMDVVWMFTSHVEAIATWSIPRDIEDDDYILTVGFNTTGGSSKQGVYYPIRRRWRSISRVANHVSFYAENRN